MIRVMAENGRAALFAYRYLVMYLAAIIWLPFTSAVAETAATTHSTPFVAAITMYRVESIIVASIGTLILGAVLSTRYEPPIDVPSGNRMNSTTTFLFAIAGGIAAFTYGLEQEKNLTILHPLWVLGVSIVTPAFVQVAFPVIVRIWYKFVKAKEGSPSND